VFGTKKKGFSAMVKGLVFFFFRLGRPFGGTPHIMDLVL
jgi:hypothetical protein